MASRRLLVAMFVVALLAVRSESHGLQDFNGGASTQTTPQMESFFGAKPEATALPEALDASTMPAKPEAASAIPSTTATGAAAATSTGGGATAASSAHPRRSVSVAAGVACGVAAVAVVGVAVAVAYVVRARRAERRGTAVQLGSSP